jgi:hypothetical protein
MRTNFRGDDGATEVSFAEEQLWLACNSTATTSPFLTCRPTMSMAARLEDSLNQQALEASLNEIIQRHKVLCSSFSEQGKGQLARRYEPALNVTLNKIDLQGLDASIKASLTNRILARDVEAPFDLARPPLLRAILLALADNTHIVVITVPHIVFDRWSKRVLALELKQLYERHISGNAQVVTPLTVCYRDYISWQRHRLDTAGGRLVKYWTEKLRGVADLTLPCDGIRGHTSSTRSASYSFTICAEVVARLETLSRSCKVTTATMMLAVLKMLLHRTTGLEDITVGVPLSDRRRPEFEHLIGLFMNVVVARTRVTNQMTFRDLVDRVRLTLVDACRHQDMPYGYLLRVIQHTGPLYRVGFSFMPNIPASRLDFPGLRVTSLWTDSELPSSAELSLHVRLKAGALMCRIVYKADLFSPHRVSRFANQFETLITAILDGPQRRVDAYALH